MTLNPFKWFGTKSLPTTKEDSIAYSSGSGATYLSIYNDYIKSAEVLDKVVRIVGNIASLAKLEVYRINRKGEKKPYVIKNVDLKYHLNEFDSPAGFNKKIFSSLMTHGAAIVIAEADQKTKYINFYVYNPADFKINATENAMISEFIYTSKSGSQISFKPKDVIYIVDSIDVSNFIYAISRLKSLNDLLQLQADIMKAQKEYYSSGGKNSVVISPEEPMSTDSAKKLRTAFQEFVSSRKIQTLFLNTKVNVKEVSNAESSEAIMKALTQINNLVIESFGIPHYLLGDYKGYQNDQAIVTASRVFFTVHLKPLFKEIEYKFTKYFRETLQLKDAIVEFNYEDVDILENSIETQTEIAGKLYKLGLISMNEARQMVELEALPTEEANWHMLPAYLVSSQPVAIENYKDMIGSIGQSQGNEPKPSGSSGGADNTPLDNKPTDPGMDISVSDNNQ